MPSVKVSRGRRTAVVVALVVAVGWLLLQFGLDHPPSIDYSQMVEHQPASAGNAGAPASSGAPESALRRLGLEFAFEDGQPVAGMELTDAEGRVFQTDVVGSVSVQIQGRYSIRMGAVAGVVDVRATGGSYSVPRIGVCRLLQSASQGAPLRLDAGPTSLAQFMGGGDSPVRLRFTKQARLGGEEQPQLVLPYGEWRLTVRGGRWRVVPEQIRVDAPLMDFAFQLVENERTSLGVRVLDESSVPVSGIEVRQAHTNKVVVVGRTDGEGRLFVDRAAFPAIGHPLFDFAVEGLECQPRLSVGPFAWGTEDNLVIMHRRSAAWLRIAQGGALIADLDWVATLHRSVGGLNDGLPPVLLPEPPGRARLPATHAASDWILCRRGNSTVIAHSEELVRSESSGVDFLDVPWPEEVSIGVLVVDGSGRPVSGATANLVLACDLEDAMRFGPIVESDWLPGNLFSKTTVLSISRAVSDATGRALLRGAVNQHVYVRVDGPSGFAPAVTQITGAGLTVVLRGSGSLRGSIQGMPADKRKNVAFYERILWTLEAVPLAETGAVTTNWCELKGVEYRMTGLSQGEYRLLVRQRQSGTTHQWDMGKVRVEGDVVRDMDLADLPMHPFTLKVEGLEKFSSATLTVYRTGNDLLSPHLQSLAVRDGQLEVTLPPGTYGLRARVPAGRDGGYQDIESDGVFECPGTGGDRVRFVVEPGEIRLITRAGDPVATQWFVVRTQAGFFGPVQTDTEGVVTFDTWPCQKFDLQKASFSSSRSWTGVGRRIEVTRGQASAVVD
jgi:hypothetical protein